MKTLPAFIFLSALVAFVFSSHSLAAAASLTFGACLVSMFLLECSRTIKPLQARAPVVQFSRPARRARALELAA